MKRSLKLAFILIAVGLFLMGGTYLSGEVTRTSWWMIDGGGFREEVYQDFRSPEDAETAFKNREEEEFSLVREEISIDKVKELKGDFKYYKIIVRRSGDDALHIHYTYPVLEGGEEQKLKIEEADGIVNITQDQFEDRYFNSGGLGDYLVVDIRVPDNKKVEINQATGILDIHNVDLELLSIGTGTGETNIKDSRIKEFVNTVEMGDSEIQNSFIDNAKMTLTMGTLEILGSEIKGSDIKVNAGDVDIESTKLLGVHQLAADAGDIEIQLNQKRNEIGIDSETEMGSILINGEEGNIKENKEGFENFLTLRANMGDIELKTE